MTLTQLANQTSGLVGPADISIDRELAQRCPCVSKWEMAAFRTLWESAVSARKSEASARMSTESEASGRRSQENIAPNNSDKGIRVGLSGLGQHSSVSDELLGQKHPEPLVGDVWIKTRKGLAYVKRKVMLRHELGENPVFKASLLDGKEKIEVVALAVTATNLTNHEFQVETPNDKKHWQIRVATDEAFNEWMGYMESCDEWQSRRNSWGVSHTPRRVSVLL